MSKTSPSYVHPTCADALQSNGNITKAYFVQPSVKHAPVLLKCQRASDGKGYAVFNHDTEAEMTVTGQTDPCGSFRRAFHYGQSLETVSFVVDHSSECQQYTAAQCKGIIFVSGDCTWLLDRNNQKLLFWGGGPQHGRGCQCGITKSCALSSTLCNCDINNNVGNTFYRDEGFVTLKQVLPLTGIAVGDTASPDVEVLKYTIGPLRCVV